MAYAIDTETLVDTATTTVLHSTGRATDATEVDATIFDASASKYALATLTLSAATTASDRWCIGEIISSNDGTAIHMVVQDQVLGGTTMQVYRCTSGTDDTPLGWSGTTLPGTTKTLTGSVSGTHTITTSGTVASTFVKPNVLTSLGLDIGIGILAPACLFLFIAFVIGPNSSPGIGKLLYKNPGTLNLPTLTFPPFIQSIISCSVLIPA